jgi:hypothetical protein
MTEIEEIQEKLVAQFTSLVELYATTGMSAAFFEAQGLQRFANALEWKDVYKRTTEIAKRLLPTVPRGAKQRDIVQKT